MRGDEFLAREGIGRVDFLKLDVEGAEHLVLQGLEEYLQNGRIRSYSLSTGGSTSSPIFFFEISISSSSDTATR